MRRDDIEKMAGAFIRHTPERESFYFDDAAGFGIAALSHDTDDGIDWGETEHAVVAFNGFIAARPYAVEQRGPAAAGVIVDTLMSGASPESLAGEFTFALWSKQAHELTLTNDPFGKFALFYLRDDASGVIVFATEAKAILAHPLGRREIDPHGFSFYLFETHISPPFAAYTGMKRLVAGESVRISSQDELHAETYWSYPPPSEDYKDLDTWSREIAQRHRKVLSNLVEGKERVGLLLGAGIDSSLIYGRLKAYHPEVEVVPITATYPLDGRHKYVNLDLPYAQRLAEHWGDTLVEVPLSLPTTAHLIEPVLRQTDQPFFNVGNNISLLALTDVAEDLGLSLLFSGQGAGENFGMQSWRKVLEAQAEGNLLEPEDIYAHFRKAEQFSAERQARLLRAPPPDVDADFVTSYQGILDRLPSRDPYDVSFYAIRQIVGREHIFHSVNAATDMRPGRLVNVFYDWPTASYGVQIPPEFKGSRDINLRKATTYHDDRHLIPQFVFDRAKRGLPGLEFNNGEFPNLERRLLSREVVESQGIFNPDYFAKVLTKKGLRKSLLMAQIWLDIHIFQSEETFGLIEADRRLQASTSQ